MKKKSLPVLGEEGPTSEQLNSPVLGDPTTSEDELALELERWDIFQPNSDFDRLRSEANVEILQLLAQFLTDYPTQRFGQALNNLGLVTADSATVEPQVQLERVRTALRNIK